VIALLLRGGLKAKRSKSSQLQHPLPMWAKEPKEIVLPSGDTWVKGWRSTWEHADL